MASRRLLHESRAVFASLLTVPLLVVVLLLSPQASADEQSDATRLVEQVHAAAMALDPGRSGGATLGTISDSFDGEGIAKAVLGTRWRSASADERTAVVDALVFAIAHRLADRVQRTQDRNFALLGTKTLANGDILVRSEFRRALRPPTLVNWRVRHCRGGLCIGDVFLNGGSVTVQQRDRIARLLASNGGSIPALVASLRKGRV